MFLFIFLVQNELEVKLIQPSLILIIHNGFAAPYNRKKRRLTRVYIYVLRRIHLCLMFNDASWYIVMIVSGSLCGKLCELCTKMYLLRCLQEELLPSKSTTFCSAQDSICETNVGYYYFLCPTYPPLLLYYVGLLSCLNLYILIKARVARWRLTNSRHLILH